MTGLFDIRRVAQKRKHTLIAELAEAGQVDHFALNGRYIDLEVAGMDDSAKRSLYRKRNSVGNAVVNIDELNAKAPQPEHIPCFLGKDLRIVKQIMLLKLELDKRSCERRCVDGYIKFGHNIRDSTDMILVTVGKDNASHSVGIGFKIRNVGYDNVDTVHLLIREAQAAVYNDNICAALKGGHVFSDLSETAKRDNFDFRCHICLHSLLLASENAKQRGPRSKLPCFAA